jgi:hypothetical protein
MKPTGAGREDWLLLFPLGVSFALIVHMAGGLDGFMNIVDVAARETAGSILSVIRSL